MISIAFFAILAAVSASMAKSASTSSLGAGAFEVYSNPPTLTINSPSKVAPTRTQLVQLYPEGASTIASIPNLPMTKSQLEQVLGSALDVKFNLEVLADRDSEKSEGDSIRDGGMEPKVLGQIPVHLKVHHLSIGGVLIPTMTSEFINKEQGPVNYGNIHV